jgi:hypothetical protein
VHESPSRFPVLQPDSPVRFACTECGECCFDQTVLLDEDDVARMARALGVATGALFTERVLARTDDGRAQILMRRVSAKSTMCPFLTPVMESEAAPRAFRCSLHGTGGKPRVCSLSPIAITVTGEYRLVPPVDGCPGMERGEATTVAAMLSAADSAGSRTPG